LRSKTAIACVAAALLCALLPALASAASPSRVYVSLGDSYTAGPLVPRPTGDPIDCGRSTNNYPALVANSIRPSVFRDVSCGSAKTTDMTEPQTGLPLGGTNPPQFNALDRGVGLVTVGIGGNDMGFGGIVGTCVELGLESLGRGQPCTEHFNRGGVDEVARRIRDVVAPRLAKVIQGIQARSPNARVVVVGDPNPVPRKPGCYPAVPIAPGDLPYLEKVARGLHEMKKRVGPANGAEFVDLFSGSIGHDICKLPPVKWYEGVVPTEPAYPAHPNIRGMQFAAREVLGVLRRPVPNDFAILGRRTTQRGRIALRLRVPYRGRFRIVATAAGGRVAYGTKRELIGRARTLWLGLRPSRAGRRLLRRRGRIPVRLKVTFDPIAAPALTRTTALGVGAGRLVLGRVGGVRSARRGRPLRLRVRARGARLRRVRIVLRNRRGRVIGRSRRFTLPRGRRRVVRVRVARRLRPGRYAFRGVARGRGGAVVREAKRILIL